MDCGMEGSFDEMDFAEGEQPKDGKWDFPGKTGYGFAAGCPQGSPRHDRTR
jgi:hypothetical protein